MNRPSWIFTVTAVITATTGLPAYAATINQGDPVQQAEAEHPGEKIGPKALLLQQPMPPERPNIGIRRIGFPSMTEPIKGGIEDIIEGKPGKQHRQTIDDRGGPVNRRGGGCVKLRLRVHHRIS